MLGPLRNCSLWLALLLASALFGRPALADAIVITQAMKAATIAQIFVADEQLRIELEVGARDLKAFQNALPDELFTRLTGNEEPFDRRRQTFLREDWVIQADGQPLPGELKLVRAAKRIARDEITGEPLPVQPENAEIVINVQLHYPLPRKPQTLKFHPPPGQPPATIGFVVYHRGVAVNDFRYLSGSETLRLDWSDPWYSQFERKILRRRYFAPAAAFLYVENFEVRKELIFRAKDLQPFVDLGLAETDVVPAERREAICQLAADFLQLHTPVTIDGQPQAGALDRVHFVSRTLRTSSVVEPGVDIDLDTALMGAIYIYPIEKLPHSVSMRWDLFNERIKQVPAVATDEAGGMPWMLEPDAETLSWTNFLTNPTMPAFAEVNPPPESVAVPLPWLSLACLGGAAWLWFRQPRLADDQRKARPWAAIRPWVLLVVAGAAAFLPGLRWELPILPAPRVSTEDAAAVTLSLLHNVYRAFDYRDESVVYDILSRSVGGDLLTQIYLETRQSLTLASQGGARVKVNKVDLLACRSAPVDGQHEFVADCEWTVTGSVGHWGHIHQRKNRYHGQLAITDSNGQWKLTEIELLSEERL